MAEHSRGQDSADPSSASSRPRAAGDIIHLGRIAARTLRLAPGNDNRRPNAHLIQIALIALTAIGAAALILLVLF